MHGIDSLPGKQLGSYTLSSLIGKGERGAVFLAKQPQETRQVAIKVLVSPDGEAFSSRWLNDFYHRVEQLIQLRHPYILPIYEYGDQDNLAYLVLPFIQQGSLQNALRAGKALSLSDTLSIVDQLGKALSFAHEHGITHQHIKPANIMHISQDQVLLSDFSLDLSHTASIDQDLQGFSHLFYTLITGKAVPNPAVASFPGTAGLPKEIEQLLSQTVYQPAILHYPTIQDLTEAFSTTLMELLMQRYGNAQDIPAAVNRDDEQEEKELVDLPLSSFPAPPRTKTAPSPFPSFTQPPFTQPPFIQPQTFAQPPSQPLKQPVTPGFSFSASSQPVREQPLKQKREPENSSNEMWQAPASTESSPLATSEAPIQPPSPKLWKQTSFVPGGKFVTSLCISTILAIFFFSFQLSTLHAAGDFTTRKTSPQPTPTASANALLYFDPLNQDNHHWPVGKEMSFVGSSYRVTNLDQYPTAIILKSSSFSPDIAYTLAVTDVSGHLAQSAYGLIFCYQEIDTVHKTFYLFEVMHASTVEYRLWYYDNRPANTQAWKLLWSQQAGSEFHRPTATTHQNVITILLKNTATIFVMNSKTIGTINDLSLKKGAIGLSVTRTGTIATFSCLMIKHISPQTSIDAIMADDTNCLHS